MKTEGMRRSGTRLGCGVRVGKVRGYVQRDSKAPQRAVYIRSFGPSSSLWEDVIGKTQIDGSLVDNVRLGSTWTVTVTEARLPRGSGSSAHVSFRHSSAIRVNRCDLEAEEHIGTTNLPNETIRKRALLLLSCWGDIHDVFWNNQHFAICLALVILTPESLDMGKPLANKLLGELAHAAANLGVKRHLGCMGIFAACGIATFGVGVFAAWAAAGGFMISDSIAVQKAVESMARVEETFPELG